MCHVCGKPWSAWRINGVQTYVDVTLELRTCCNFTFSKPVDPAGDEPTDPDASVAAALLRDDEPILSAERDVRASEAP